MTTEVPTNDVNLEAPVVETTVEAPKFDGLSNRDALKESIAIHRDGKDPEEVKAVAPTSKEVKQAVDADSEPPAAFNKEEAEAWRMKDIAGVQRAFRRIDTARLAELSRAQTAEKKAREEIEKERASVKPARDMAERVRNYLSVRGEENLPDEVKIAQALQLVDEMRKGDGKAVKAELLKMGIDLDKASEKTTSEKNPDIDALQKTVEALKQERENEKLEKTTHTFDSAFQFLRSQKTRAGEPVFPDLFDTSEKGMRFAERIGSRTSDPYFKARVAELFPDGDFTVLVREAYKAELGRVSGEPVQVSTKSNQQHIDKSRRAAAAVPGRTAPVTSRSEVDNLRGKLSSRAAMAKALEIHREH